MRRLFSLLVLCLALTSSTPAGAVGPDSVLILYENAQEIYGSRAESKMLVNLLGHFELPIVEKAVADYDRGEVDEARLTFYIGNDQNVDPPEGLLKDMARNDRPVVWLGDSLESLADSKRFGRRFEKRFGLRRVTRVYDYPFVAFRGKTFGRAETELTVTEILDPAKASVEAEAVRAGEVSGVPYAAGSGGFRFFADNPLENVWSEDLSYIVFAELLHTLTGIDHPVEHRALVRLEDVAPNDDPDSLKAIADYLSGRGVPFGVSVIPRFADPLGAYGPPQAFDLDTVPEMVNALTYLESRGGTLFMHGYTHQYRDVPNPYNGVTGLDYEFFLAEMDGETVVETAPVPEDSREWVLGRLTAGFDIFERVGLDRPSIWVTPHYRASELDYEVISETFAALNGRPRGQYFPYVIERNMLGSRFLPENLGYINPETRPAASLVDLADRNLVVRDGFASFFFHPEVDIEHLKTAVEGIQGLGYTFVDISEL